MNMLVLADGESELVKFAFVALVVIIWGISALANAIKKSSASAQATPPPPIPIEPRRERLAHVRSIPLPGTRGERQGGGPPRPAPAHGPRQGVATAPRPLPAMAAATPQPAKRRPATRASAPLVPPASVMRNRTTSTPAQTATPFPPPPPARVPAAGAITNWVRADTIRSQFILCEVLQRPLALRGPRP